MKLSFFPYTLNLKHTFRVSSFSRTTTPVVITEICHGKFTGYGEASMPPYLGESQESVTNFLSKIDVSNFSDPFHLEDILNYVDQIEEGNNAAKAAFDIALHDLYGKIIGEPLYKIWGLNKEKAPLSSFTIGIDSEEMIKQKVKEAERYKILKVKLGTENDKEIINTIRSVTDVPLMADANQGWKNKEEAAQIINWLEKQNVILIEQPMPKEDLEGMLWLLDRSPLPLIADESCRRLNDIMNIKDCFTGINIKLMKSSGLREAYKMILLARSLGLKVMLGCMTETSCAVSAAAQLSPLVDWADLDGAELISNDIFEGMKIQDGKIILNTEPGIGVIKKINNYNTVMPSN
jgi:L-Ala-D/L-Glu epimerase